MTNYIYLADVFAWIIFLFAHTAQPAASHLSAYELHRLAKSGDEDAKKLERRKKLLPGTLLIKRWLEIILVVLIVWLTVTLQGWLWGIIVSVIALAIADMLSRWQPIKREAKKYWTKVEPHTLAFIHRHASWLAHLGPREKANQPTIHSQQELAHLINASPAFTGNVKKHLQATLDFHENTVGEIMIPRENIAAVDQGDTLGPIILDDLHKTGLNYFPVYEQNIDHIVGVLRLDKLVGDMRKTHKAKKVMETGVSRVHETESLSQALATLLRERQNLLIVVNKSKKTTGAVTLQALIEKLTGYPLAGNGDNNSEVKDK